MTHRTGKIWMLGALILFITVPLTISIVTNTFPTFKNFLPGFIATAVIFWPVTTIEVFTFSPMIGSASYLAFVTGNLTNLKVPAALNAIETNNLEKGSKEAQIMGNIAIASSSIITTLIILIGAILIIPLTPILESEVLKPAFDNIIPALFGALSIVYIQKRFKLVIIPLTFMILFFLFVPNSGDLVGIMVPVGVVITLVTARIMYKKNKI